MQDEPSVNDQLVFTLPNEITMKTGGLPHQLTWSLKLLTKAPDETSEYWKFAKVAKILQANFRIKLPKNIPESKEFDQSFLELKRQARSASLVATSWTDVPSYQYAGQVKLQL